MICSASQIDSFWNTLVLSNDCESSMRAIVIDPPCCGVEALEPLPPARAAAAAPAAATAANARNRKVLRAFTVGHSFYGGSPVVFCIQHTAPAAICQCS